MLPKKNNWRKLPLQISPILIVSIGLHGLALLIPVPDKAPPAEPEIEMPDPISVTELPKVTRPKPTAPPESIFAPPPVVAPAPAPVEPPPPQIIVVEAEPPAQPPRPDPLPAPTLDPTPNPIPDPIPDPTPTPDPTVTPTPDPVVQVRRSRGTSPAEEKQKRDEGTQNLETLTAANPGAFKPVKKALNLSFPADSYCIKTEAEEVVSEVEAFVAIVIEQYDDGSLEFIDGGIINTADYDVVDTWIDQTVFPPDEQDPNIAETPDIPATADLDIFRWVQDSYTKTLFEDGETVATFGVSVTVALVNNCLNN